jgi:uncharacterized protein YdaU (DUF1376 family)
MSKKDTFYFSHDYNARMDSKIKELIYKLGIEGYGIYWALIEDLYNNANAMRMNYERIAFELRTQNDKIKSVIHDFNLFEIDGEIFSSKSVQKRLNDRNDKSISAQKSANKRWGNTNALQTHSERNAIKERKGKEIKGKEIIRGVSFSENKLEVIFEDGTSQKLGNNQLCYLNNNTLKPREVVKGLID